MLRVARDSSGELGYSIDVRRLSFVGCSSSVAGYVLVLIRPPGGA